MFGKSWGQGLNMTKIQSIRVSKFIKNYLEIFGHLNNFYVKNKHEEGHLVVTF